jgi:hypothetical protein
VIDDLRARLTALEEAAENVRVIADSLQRRYLTPLADQLVYEKLPPLLNAVDDLAELLREPPEAMPLPPDIRALLIRADSFLSLLWHRYVPADRRDFDLQRDVDRTIQDLRDAARAVASEAP